MNDTVRKFGEKVSGLIERGHPEAARRILAAVFRGYGKVIRWSKNGQDSEPRRYLMSFCNDKMADSIRGEGRAVIVSLMTPCQIFHAMNIPVMVPEGLSCYMTASGCERIFLERAEAGGVPESLCSYHKMLIGMTLAGVLPKPMMIVNTTLACDANQLSFRMLADYFHVPHFVLDVPGGQGDSELRYLTRQMNDMIRFAEYHSGKTLDQEKLRKVMEASRDSVANYRRALALKQTRHESSRMTFLMMDALAMHIYLGTPQTLKYTGKLTDHLRKLPEKRTGIRILWVHTLPYWQNSIDDIFRYNDKAEVVLCDMNVDNLSDLDPRNPCGTLAKQLLKNSMNGPGQRRIDRILAYARQMNIDGIIWFCHWGCKQTLGMAANAKEQLEAAGFPTLTLDGDGCDTRNVQDGQMATRAGAFMEQLEGTHDRIYM